MRKHQKQKLLELTQTFSEAHREIQHAISQGDTTLARDMLGECQNFAVAFGESIEEAEGEGHVTVSYVEQYCEALFQVYESIGNASVNGTVNADNIVEALEKALLQIKSSVKNDIAAKTEAVFFPYKASMWDSLESVYLAARDDPGCDAYCVPIPYYEKNPDGSFGEMHYEGAQYPKGIEVLDWQEYDFENRRPDAIYIHNPYDNCNYVTSVHPRFYSSNLKKYTEELVYIPYFILSELEPDNQAAVDAMKHFIWLPGVIYADKVIVQSEKMKQIYVNEYLKAAKANGLTGNHMDRGYLEQKFLGLGSPKIDKVCNTKKDDLEIPKEWLDIIRKPDGSWKKIILYNTGVGALLKNDEQWVTKIEHVLRVFEENQDEVTLLWRPHPLLEDTMKSMRPGLLQRYRQIREAYVKEGWGIYDDTADMDRAVVLSDAYYGDMSSVLNLYQKTGKPIMVQNVNIS